MSTQRDYYEILGLKKGSSVDEVKKSYRQLVMQYHPDRVPADQKKAAEEKFKEISESYAVLSDPQKKQLYDQYGHSGVDSRYSQEDIFRGADFGNIFRGGGVDAGIFEDLFADLGFDIFGTKRGGGRKIHQGEDAQIELSITLEEAGSGCEKEVTYQRFETCANCQGSGAKDNSGKTACPTCKGYGQVANNMGFISFARTCPTCQGQGKVIKNKCPQCMGNGHLKARKTVTIKIPAGVDTGSVLRLRQEGHYAHGGYGDLYAHIRVKSHQIFHREGDDIICKATITIPQAVLGAEITVPTLAGTAAMKIPAGTQPGSIFRMRDKGISNLRSRQCGDELVEVNIEIPRKLSNHEKKLYEELLKLS